MNATLPAPTEPSHDPRAGRAPGRRHRRAGALVLLAVAAAVVVALGLGLPQALFPSAPSAGGLPAIITGAVQDGDEPGAEDGFIGDGETVSPFDTGVPAIANLQPDLRTAVQGAAEAAEADGVTVTITSGWRDEKYQRWLYEREVDRSGAQAAEGLVATGSSSRHLTGDAVDVGPTDAAYWVQQHGSDYGLCQMYSNEVWHYELAVAPGGTCPQPFLDAADRP